MLTYGHTSDKTTSFYELPWCSIPALKTFTTLSSLTFYTFLCLP
jgi:hypothetical protein